MPDPVVVVVGAGPAGLRAADTLFVAGLRPIVIDEAACAGGQIYRQPPSGAERPLEDLYGFEANKAARLHRIGRTLAMRTDYRPSTLVWNVAGRSLNLLGPGGQQTLVYDRLLLATGAMDRVLPFPGWTLPGVFTLGGAQIALKAQGMAVGARVALVGAGPLLPLLAHQYLRAGGRPVAVLDVTPFAAKVRALPGLAAEPQTLAKGLWYQLSTALRGAPIQAGVQSIAVQGTDCVTGLVWTDRSGRRHGIACDAVAASFGLRSETQVADLAGCRFDFDAVQHQWLPERSVEGRSSQPHVYLAGDGSGIGGADVAEMQGERTARALLADLGHSRDLGVEARLDAELSRQTRFRAALEAAYPYPGHLVDAVADDEIVCRCEGIRAGAIREAAVGRDAREINRVKAMTRVGMGRCQGRVCGHAAAEILARATGEPVESVGRLRGQPPVKPIPMTARLSESIA